MQIDYKILAAVSSPLIKNVLHQVVQGRAVRLSQLVGDDTTQEDVLRAIDILREAQLIRETPAPVADLRTYFITASGLQADRMVQD